MKQGAKTMQVYTSAVYIKICKRQFQKNETFIQGQCITANNKGEMSSK